MVVISRFVKFFWFLSLLLFFATLFAAYFYWPQIVDIKLNKHVYGTEDIYLTKEVAFYYVIGFVSLINIVMTVLGATLNKLPKSLLLIPNAAFWTETTEKVLVVRALLKNWVMVFSGLINLLSALFLFALLVINYQDQVSATRDFDWVLPLSFIVLILAIIYPLVRLNIKKHSVYGNGYFNS